MPIFYYISTSTLRWQPPVGVFYYIFCYRPAIVVVIVPRLLWSTGVRTVGDHYAAHQYYLWLQLPTSTQHPTDSQIECKQIRHNNYSGCSGAVINNHTWIVMIIIIVYLEYRTVNALHIVRRGVWFLLRPRPDPIQYRRRCRHIIMVMALSLSVPGYEIRIAPHSIALHHWSQSLQFPATLYLSNPVSQKLNTDPATPSQLIWHVGLTCTGAMCFIQCCCSNIRNGAKVVHLPVPLQQFQIWILSGRVVKLCLCPTTNG